MWNLKPCQWTFPIQLRIGLSSSLNGSLTRHDFVTIFGKYTDICRTSKCGHISLFNIKKLHLLITIGYFFKICRCWEAVELMVANSSFPKFRFLSENRNFTTGNRYCQLFTWRVSVTSFIFRKIPAKYPTLNSHNFSVNHSLKWKLCSVEKAVSSGATQSHKWFLRRWPPEVSSQHKGFMCISTFF